ncbi:TPA: hypothetical protein ACJKA7_000425 [Neisseria meningitidis]
MEKIHFEWYRGDDELETLVFESEGEPMDFAGCDFAMDIVPEHGAVIRLSLSDGISVAENRVQIAVSHDKTDGVGWRTATIENRYVLESFRTSRSPARANSLDTFP